ncbi:hypothetical protein [Halomonas elongata]|uniref:hypothetical protein n=1 Tax=Halomonas elongata TaxID=2746 RepID=UPI0023B0AA4D|nr:hypothetical protein [Halomonas elongata]
MSSYYIDINESGHFCGWADPLPNGAPSEVKVILGGQSGLMPIFYSSYPRPDVQSYGKALFSGFMITLSSAFPVKEVAAEIKDQEVSLEELKGGGEDPVHVDVEESDKAIGWVDFHEPLNSFVVCDGERTVCANVYEREDIANLKGDRFRRSGFTVEGIDLAKIYWCLINNKFVYFY